MKIILFLLLFPFIVFGNIDEIESLLSCYSRPFTLLDLNAGQGQYTFAIAEEYPDSVCIMLEADPTLTQLCLKKKNLENIVLLSSSATTDVLQHLGECEHFDVILAMRGFSSSHSGWQSRIDTLLNLGHYVFISVPLEDQTLQEYVLDKGGKRIGSSQTLFLLESSKQWILQRKTWMRLPMNSKDYSVECSFSSKILIKPAGVKKRDQNKIVDWVPGINLCTFKMCKGSYPTIYQLKKCLQQIRNQKHTDWMINNMILQGCKIHMIDGEDHFGDHQFSDELYEAHQVLFSLDQAEKVQQYFWEDLLHAPPSDRQFVKFFHELFPPLGLVFDIGSDNIEFLHRYLGYGSKVLCHCPSISLMNALQTTRIKQGIYLVNDPLYSLDEIIDSYGVPDYCCIHLDPALGISYFQNFSKKIPCLAWKFTIQNEKEILKILTYLKSVGYNEFNFSIRRIPHLFLSNNKYIGINRTWVFEPQTLWEEIKACCALDPNPIQFWGYVYARRR